jgi:hypothetical protein
MLPLCKKLETYHPRHEKIDLSKHGHDGPINISDGGYRRKSENDFMKTFKVTNFYLGSVINDLTSAHLVHEQQGNYRPARFGGKWRILGYLRALVLNTDVF